MSTDAQYDNDVQTSLFMKDAAEEDSDPITTTTIPVADSRNDNLEINGRILTNGIVLRNLDEPNHVYGGHTVDPSDYSGFLPDLDDEEINPEDEEDEAQANALREKILEVQSKKVAKQVIREFKKSKNTPKEEEEYFDDDDTEYNVNDIL
jgi:hypothetical protein